MTLVELLELVARIVSEAYPEAESASIVVNVGADLPRVVLPVRVNPSPLIAG